MPITASFAPEIDIHGVTFVLPDGEDPFESVKLVQEIMRPRIGPPFVRPEDSSAWRLRFPRPAADRFEYMIEVTHASGARDVLCDPANPVRAPGPFGDKSVIEFPEYRSPGWLNASSPTGSSVEVTIYSGALRREMRTIVWTPAGAASKELLPLLVVHDGPEYDEFSSLTRWLAWSYERGHLPRARAALLQPIDRNETYSASAVYSRTLAHEILPVVLELAPTPGGRRMRAGIGASLGALAMLHAHRTYPATFGGLFLQSGSFFRQRFDSQEAAFTRFRRITRFMGKVLSEQQWPQPVPLAMTCGTAEENLLNNRHLRAALNRQGYEVDWFEHHDAHNWVSWRDTFEPALGPWLRKLWS
jgi:enterochelin esterase-like enzyme